MVANYQALAAVDTDDGSQFFNVASNFLVYGFTGQKAFFNGQDLNHTGDAKCFSKNLHHAQKLGALACTRACDQKVQWDRVADPLFQGLWLRV